MPNNPVAAPNGQFSCKNMFIMKIEICEEQQQMSICIEIPIVMDYEKRHVIFGDFSSL